MADRHWEQVSNLIGSAVHPSMEASTRVYMVYQGAMELNRIHGSNVKHVYLVGGLEYDFYRDL